MVPGHLYILLNPSFAQGFLKIGMTSRLPSDRANELSQGSGFPSPFVVAFSVPVSDCRAAEREVHTRLAQYRVNSDREFFCLELSEAIQVLSRIAGEFPTAIKNDLPSVRLTIRGVMEPFLEEVVVAKSGRVVGRWGDGKSQHEATWVLSHPEISEVFGILDRIGFSDLLDSYRNPWTDYPVLTLEAIGSDGQSKVVEVGYRGGPSTPDEFNTAFNRIRQLTQADRFKPIE